MKKILHLHLKSKWWYKILSGEKTVEYRIANEYWQKRLVGRDYDEIHIWLGYPKKTDTKKLIIKSWLNFWKDTITHQEFGDKPVDVFCIELKNNILEQKQ